MIESSIYRIRVSWPNTSLILYPILVFRSSWFLLHKFWSAFRYVLKGSFTVTNLFRFNLNSGYELLKKSNDSPV